MQELVNLVSQKTGLSEEMSRTAVETVLNYLKKRLPAPVASQIDNIVSGSSTAKGAGDVTKGLGGILGNKPGK
jgi:hypothetical protein